MIGLGQTYGTLRNSRQQCVASYLLLERKLHFSNKKAVFITVLTLLERKISIIYDVTSLLVLGESIAPIFIT